MRRNPPIFRRRPRGCIARQSCPPISPSRCCLQQPRKSEGLEFRSSVMNTAPKRRVRLPSPLGDRVVNSNHPSGIKKRWCGGQESNPHSPCTHHSSSPPPAIHHGSLISPFLFINIMERMV